MSTFRCSVVIPAYNAAGFLRAAVDSVLAQSLPALEIIVIDDGSSDRTAQRMAGYPPMVRYIAQSNQGVSAARNHGVRLACGEYVAFLDADDVWHPEKLRCQARAVEQRPELVLVATKSFDWPFNRKGGTCEEMPEFVPGPTVPLQRITWEQLVVRNRLVTSSVVARAEVLRTVGPFDTQMQGPEDRDMWLRMARLGEVANVDVPLVGYRSVAGSVSRQAVRCRSGMLRLLEKIDRAGQWPSERLRWQAYAQVHNSCSNIFSAAGLQGTAVRESLKSVAWYPLPLEAVESPFERPRRLAVHLLRLLGLKAPDPAGWNQTT